MCAFSYILRRKGRWTIERVPRTHICLRVLVAESHFNLSP